jgi:hypothetical protein
MIESIETTPRTGRRVTWDTTNPDEVRDVAGDRFTGVWDRLAVISHHDGTDDDDIYVQPGWTVVRWDDGEVTAHSPYAARVMTRVITSLPPGSQDVPQAGSCLLAALTLESLRKLAQYHAEPLIVTGVVSPGELAQHLTVHEIPRFPAT